MAKQDSRRAAKGRAAGQGARKRGAKQATRRPVRAARTTPVRAARTGSPDPARALQPEPARAPRTTPDRAAQTAPPALREHAAPAAAAPAALALREHAAPAAAAPAAAPAAHAAPHSLPHFPVVGIGASAGGLEALETFLQHVPAGSGAAYVVVQHLDPSHTGMLPGLLQRTTSMPVLEAHDGLRVERDHVYVIPPNKDLSLLHGTLHLLPLPHASHRGRVLPVDFFFRSLAEDQQELSIGVILSGAGTDGTLGLRAIKEKAGATFVQEPTSARFDGMPRSAIDAGLADVVAPVEELPGRIAAYRDHSPFIARPGARSLEDASGALEKIFVLLRARTGNDFSLYKRSTLHRRIERRMGLHQIDTLAHYVRFLRENPAEVELLFKELLIGVTSFFRDPAEWERLRREVMPALLSARASSGVVRAWVPGCSTGEEAYSLAMVYREALEPFKALQNIALQVFATDLDRDAIEKARHGVYPDNITADLSPERLRRFFVREDRGYRVSTEIRETVVFAPQSLVMDPPFTKVDILVCRNLLIYLSPEIQKTLIPLFHYCLNPGGSLFLGSAETIGSFGGLFAPLDGKSRIYRRIDQPSAMMPNELRFAPFGRPAGAGEARELEVAAPPKSAPNIQMLVDRLLVQRFSPLGILCNDRGDILYISGRAGRYLEPAVGKANLNVFAMAREGLRYELSSAFTKALRGGRAVHVRDVKVGTNGGTQAVDLTVQKLLDPGELAGTIIVILAEAPARRPPEKAARSRPPAAPRARLAQLEHELQKAREETQIIREEMQTSQEELRSANEEMRSTNEELQSTNEELTTSKEEMQSLNEELQTVNHELQSKVDELSRANNDMKNLLNSTDIATLFLDGDLRVRRFTTPTAKIIKLIPVDVGRPITDIASDLEDLSLVEDAREVLRSLVFKEKRARTRDGRFFAVKLMPYRTQENVIDGVVITFSDASASHALELALVEQASQLRQLAESLPSLVWGARPDGTFDYLSRQWLDYTGLAEAEQLGWGWLEQLHPQDRERVRDDWRAAARSGTCFSTELRIRDARGAYRWFRTRAAPIRDAAGAITKWYGTSTDIDELKLASAHGEDRVAAVLDRMSDGYLELDRDLNVVSLNRAAAHIIERERHTVIGRPLFDALPAARNSSLARKLEEARGELAGASGASLELARDKQYDVQIYPQRDPDAIALVLVPRSMGDAQDQEARR
jgi:two-component system CheB/CheR fusion protein